MPSNAVSDAAAVGSRSQPASSFAAYYEAARLGEYIENELYDSKRVAKAREAAGKRSEATRGE